MFFVLVFSFLFKLKFPRSPRFAQKWGMATQHNKLYRFLRDNQVMLFV